jgi:hypothetical protein
MRQIDARTVRSIHLLVNDCDTGPAGTGANQPARQR